MKYVLFIAIIFAAMGADAQRWWDLHWDIKAHDRGQVHFKLGYGAPRIEKSDFDKYKNYDSVLTTSGADTTGAWGFTGDGAYNLVGSGPIYAALEYGFTRTFSFALTASYTNFKASWQQRRWSNDLSKYLPVEFGVIQNDITVGGRFNYHLITTTEWDVYSGLGVNYSMYSATYYNHIGDIAFNGYLKPRGAIQFEGGIGARRFFMNRTAFYIEGGYGKSYAQAGIIIKITQPKSNRGF